MDEARDIWVQYLEAAKTEEEKDQHLAMLKDIVKRVFGTEDFKLSQCLPSQADLLEYFISEAKEIM